MQVKKKSFAFKGTQEDSSSEESSNEDDDEFAYVIKMANKILRKNSIRRREIEGQTLRRTGLVPQIVLNATSPGISRRTAHC